MRYDLFTNGVDSLKQAYICIEKIGELKEGLEHNVKDSILALNHAFETLFKYILKNENEYLIFSNIDSYMKAKEAMQQQGKSNIFEVRSNLNTVGLSEALRRLELLCNYEISGDLKGATDYLIEIRNKLQHYELIISKDERYTLIEKMKSCYELGVEFLEQYLQHLNEALEEARFEETHEDYWGDYAADMAYEQYREDKLLNGWDD
ncbi:hypothetical protein OPHB3_2991 [Oceanobacillus picturae]|uniref:Uncharacterized protein n=1 Tax=Oceanobacillus picturae TaxID=171693 RepID=A0A0U9HFJ8_9BACI|nr:hypothetical protein [Oceanobacillus picturae]GAQ19032.1 hypothetical protein OPHB3_2991 [Oceanobacillus picturae]